MPWSSLREMGTTEINCDELELDQKQKEKIEILSLMGKFQPTQHQIIQVKKVPVKKKCLKFL